MSSRRGQSRKPAEALAGEEGELKPEEMLRRLRGLLPYLNDWDGWQREVNRLERNIITLRAHGSVKLAKTLESGLPALRLALEEERVNHQFTVNQFMAELDELDRKHKVGDKRQSEDEQVEPGRLLD